MAVAWDQADHFLVPLLDGRFSVGQVIELQHGPGSPALCALTFRTQIPDKPCQPLHLSEVQAIHLITPPQDQASRWPIAGFEQIPAIRDIFPLASHTENSFADLAPQDPAIIEAFLSACHGLYPWDGFPDRDFFSNLLLDPENPPTARKTKAELTQDD